MIGLSQERALVDREEVKIEEKKWNEVNWKKSG